MHRDIWFFEPPPPNHRNELIYIHLHFNQISVKHFDFLIINYLQGIIMVFQG